nr:putative ribonuclease H-like domain-containing protein [Tanacetum cinerariifolium]
MESVKKSIDERVHHKREYDIRMNERQMQSNERKVDSSKALDIGSVVIKRSRTESDKQDTSSSSNHAYCRFTPYYLPKVRESVFVKPNRVIASGSSRNSSKESYGSNDMAHNYSLEEAKKKTQDKNTNLKPSVMHTTSLQNTTNGSKPKPRSNNQISRSLHVPKSSRGMLNGVTLVDHSRNSSSFLDSKHFVCSTCQKCVFNVNHDDCITKLLKEVNSRAKVQSPKSRNNMKPAKRIPNVNKPERWISKGYRFGSCCCSRVVDPTGSPSSTTIDQDVSFASTSPTNLENQSQVTHQGVEEQIHGHKNVQSDKAPLLYNLSLDPSSEETTLQGDIPSNLHILTNRLQPSFQSEKSMSKKTVVPDNGQNRRDLPRDNPLVSVEVLWYDIQRSKSKNKGIVSTKMELVLEQTQQEHPSDTKVFTVKMEILLEPTANKLLEDYIKMEIQIPHSSRVKFIATCSFSRLNDFITSRKNDPKLSQTLISTSSSVDVKSAFLYGTIEEEMYVCQPPGFEDPDFLYKVYKVEKSLYGLHQAPRAWYETLSTYLLENRFRRGIINKTLFIKKDKDDILLVQVYVDDITFGFAKKSLCTEFEGLIHKKFQMSFMGELTFFLGLQVMQKDDGINIRQDKYDSAKVKTVNEDVQIRALIDEKKIIVTEASSRRDLQLQDVEGTTCLPNDTIFEELARMGFVQGFMNHQLGDMSHHKKIFVTLSLTNMKREGNGFYGIITPLFETMMVQASEEKGEGLKVPTDTHHTPIVTQPSSSQPQKKQKSRKIQRKETEVPLTKPRTNKNVPTTSNDPLPSGEDRMQLIKLMTLCTNLQKQVLDLEKAKTAQAKEITDLKKRVKKLEKKKKLRTSGLKRLWKIGSTVRVESSEDKESLGDQEDASKLERIINNIDQDKEIALVDETRETMNEEEMFGVNDLDGDEVIIDATTGEEVEKSTKVSEKEVSTADPVTTAGEVVTIAEDVKAKDKGKGIMMEPEKPLKKKDQIAFDEEVARKLKVEMKAKMEEEERIEGEKDKANMVVIEQWDEVQAKTDADMELAQKL